MKETNNWNLLADGSPKIYKDYLVQFETITKEMKQCVATFISVPRHCFDNPPMDDRWFVYPGAGHTIHPIYWQELPLTKYK